MKALLAWEIDTIARIAREEYEREAQTTAIVNPQRWLEVAEATRQQRAYEDDLFRRSLYANAQRLGVYTPLPPARPRRAPDGHEIASPEHAQRWQNVISLVKRLPREHPYRGVHHELVTQRVLEARHSGEEWEPTILEGAEILHLLGRAERELVAAPTTDAPTAAPAHTLAAQLERARSTR